MYKGYKIIPVIPAGREKTMSILIKHLLRFKDNPVDEVYLFENTKEKKDIRFINSLNDGDFFKVIRRPSHDWDEPKQLNTGKFYKWTLDPQTIYIRFDDDIVYIDDLFFKNILDFRINNPNYFLIAANIWNNAVISYIHQKAGRIGKEAGIVKEKFCMDEVGWRSGKFAVYIHNLLLEKIKQGKTNDLFFDKEELKDVKRFSISCFAYFGKDFAKFKGEVRLPEQFANSGPYYPLDEEIFLCEYYPMEKMLTSAICGSALVSHYTFGFQREEVNKTDILERYKKIANDKLSSSYYNLLER